MFAIVADAFSSLQRYTYLYIYAIAKSRYLVIVKSEWRTVHGGNDAPFTAGFHGEPVPVSLTGSGQTG